MKKTFFGLGVLALFLCEASASVMTWNFTKDEPKEGGNGGDIKYIEAEYSVDSGVETFSWTHVIDPVDALDVSQNFWLVVSIGPNPKKLDNELAIFYGDAENNLLTSYVYHGKNSGSSYLVNEYIQTDALSSSVSGGLATLSFDVDVTDMNSLPFGPDWMGARFGDKIGIWFHTNVGAFTYGVDGEITNMDVDPSTKGWYDRKNLMTTIPEPSSFLLAVGGMGLMAWRRKKNKA